MLGVADNVSGMAGNIKWIGTLAGNRDLEDKKGRVLDRDSSVRSELCPTDTWAY